MDEDTILMERAFDSAKKSIAEDEEVHPKVGAIIVRDGKVLVASSRNENERGSHAEYLAFKKAREMGIDINGATLYTTLEPCTYRNEQIPCAEHIVQEGIVRVVIGMTDPNPKIEKDGIRILRKAGIDVTSGTLEDRIKELNSAFIEKHRQTGRFALIEGVIADYEASHPGAIDILRTHYESARKNLDLKPGDIGHYREIASYEEFLGLLGDFQPKDRDAIVRAFLFSLEKHNGQIYNSENPLPYTFHTTQVAATILGFGSASAREVITGLWHDLMEDTGVSRDSLYAKSRSYGFSDEESKKLIEDLELLNRKRYSGSYIEATMQYFNGLKSSPSALKTKAADNMVNMRQWVDHSGFLIRKGPHLAGKYFFESSQFLSENDDALKSIAPDVPYRLERIRQTITRILSPEDKTIIVDACGRFGQEVQREVSNILYSSR